jgi:integrase
LSCPAWPKQAIAANTTTLTSARQGRALSLVVGRLTRVDRRPDVRGALPVHARERIRVHDLRHVFASHFVMGGGDVFTLQRILGHSTPQLTSDTYAHLSPSHLAGETDRVQYPEPRVVARVLELSVARSATGA